MHAGALDGKGGSLGDAEGEKGGVKLHGGGGERVKRRTKNVCGGVFWFCARNECVRFANPFRMRLFKFEMNTSPPNDVFDCLSL